MAIPCHFDQAIESISHVIAEPARRQAVTTLAAGAIRFVFDHQPRAELHGWGVELLDAGAFQLPAACVYFEQPTTLVDTGEPALSATLVFETDGWFQAYSATGFDGRWYAWIPLALKHQGGSTFYARQLQPDTYDGMTAALWKQETTAVICELITTVAALSVKGVERETVQPSRQVRRWAERHGLPVEPDYTVIRVPAQRRDPQGGHHASPLPHFRRGHVRRLEDGRLTKVRPAFIMAEPQSIPIREVRL